MNSLRFIRNNLPILKYFNRLECSSVEVRNFSSLLGIYPSINKNTSTGLNSKQLFKSNLNLTPTSIEFVPKCGLKVYGKPRLRCKFCYYAGIEGVLHVFCTKYPRHKQRALIPGRKKYGWILTHACQSKYRPY